MFKAVKHDERYGAERKNIKNLDDEKASSTAPVSNGNVHVAA